MNHNKIQVYFMPGMAASSKIFEYIKLDEKCCECNFLEWEIPYEKESLQDYAYRISKKIIHEDIVLVGVSFGGVLVQEMSAFLKVKKLIIISSIKGREEMPKRMKMSSALKLYRLAPMSLVSDIEKWAKYAFGDFAKNKIELYKMYLSVNDKRYLKWALREMLNWSPKEKKNVIHIHGERDTVFPVKRIKEPYISVPKGGHAMIVVNYRWFNQNLPKIIIGENV